MTVKYTELYLKELPGLFTTLDKDNFTEIRRITFLYKGLLGHLGNESIMTQSYFKFLLEHLQLLQRETKVKPNS